MSNRVGGVSYAGALRGNSERFGNTPAVNNINSVVDQSRVAFSALDADCNDLLGKDFQTCLKKVGEFSKTYALLTDRGEKTKALFGLLISIRLRG